MYTIKKEFDRKTNKGFPRIALMYDKQKKKFMKPLSMMTIPMTLIALLQMDLKLVRKNVLPYLPYSHTVFLKNIKAEN
jgi:hypothetical protein